MDYDDYVSYRDQIMEIGRETDSRVAYDGEKITVIQDDCIGHFEIDRGRRGDSFKIYDGHLDDDLGGRVDPMISTDSFEYARSEWKAYLEENMTD